MIHKSVLCKQISHVTIGRWYRETVSEKSANWLPCPITAHYGYGLFYGLFSRRKNSTKCYSDNITFIIFYKYICSKWNIWILFNCYKFLTEFKNIHKLIEKLCKFSWNYKQCCFAKIHENLTFTITHSLREHYWIFLSLATLWFCELIFVRWLVSAIGRNCQQCTRNFF